MQTPARLWHFTCSHSVDDIKRMGSLRPHPHPLLDVPLVWLTDLEHPFREALGLTSHMLMCDRTEHRFQVADTLSAVWWPAYARNHHIDRRTRGELESAPGAMPAHWWVTAESVPIAASDAAPPSAGRPPADEED
jgi:hypothetical protein